MRVSPQLAKGFLGRSVDELKRLSAIALKAEGTRRADSPFVLIDFSSPESTEACKIMSDADVGGYSKANLDWQTTASSTSNKTTSHPSHNSNAHARFHGAISTVLPPNRPHIQRSGYAAWRTLDRGSTVFGRSLWDIDPYAYLALRIKSDGRKYFVNIQTESIVPTDLHQHRLYAKRPGEWETVWIKWNEFVRTNHGVVVEPQTELLRQKVRTVGVGLIDRVEGPYELCVERIWASNRLGVDEVEEEGEGSVEKESAAEGKLDEREGHKSMEGSLRSKMGNKVRWNDKAEKEPS